MADRPLHILLADDNPVVQKITLAILQRQGFRVDVVGDGIEVLQALDAHPYDVILMDLQMPNKDGLEATREIRTGRSDGHQPYIIGITASITREICEACFDVGMDDYLSKPFRPEELAEALQRVQPGGHPRG